VRLKNGSEKSVKKTKKARERWFVGVFLTPRVMLKEILDGDISKKILILYLN
jgi:hypothetical protein